ncbi:MAG TPA: SAM-dependent methyltransferase [Pilimelia sp.]|nr:SAM-dependent methyltransferase [Pilimelia sp.]
MSTIDLKTDVPHSARVYDYLLGGKDNFEADRAAADEIVRRWPTLPASMRANRSFMTRAAHYAAAELGIRQFLDIGTGLPTAPNLHDVVQAVAPESRVVYVDNDPIVLVHARALLTSTPQGRTSYLHADLRTVADILSSAEVTDTLDLSRPVSVSIVAVMQFFTDEEEAHRVLDALIDALCPGSALTLSVPTSDSAPAEAEAGTAAYRSRGMPGKIRTRAEVEALFRGLPPVDPGVTLVHRWHPDEAARALSDNQVHMYGGVAVKR